MWRSTLALRLIAASAIWIVGTLCAAGLLLLLLFRDHIERRFDAALADHLEELVAASEVGPDGALQLSWQPFDPRASTGRAWGGTGRSRSATPSSSNRNPSGPSVCRSARPAQPTASRS
jgi:hypothetical protein